MAKKSGEGKQKSERSFLGKLITLLLFLIILASIGIFVFIRFLSVYIGPGEFGVKQINIGFLVFEQGIQEKIYDSGYTLQIPVLQQVHVFPRQLQVLDFTDRDPILHKFRHYEKPAFIQTSDGYFVSVDVSIVYRIADPYKLLTTIGPGEKYISEGIVPKAEPILKQTLGELTTEGFYNSPLRVEKADAARDELNKILKDKGLQVDAVLIRYFRYSEQIQKNIEEKKLKDQLVFRNQAEARAATEGAKLKKVIEEGEAAVRVKLEEGKAYFSEKSAEKERYIREKKAEANLLIQLAEAKRTRMKNDALTGEGASRIVGFKMAEVLKGINIIMIPSDGSQGFNPLDLNQTMKVFEVK